MEMCVLYTGEQQLTKKVPIMIDKCWMLPLAAVNRRDHVREIALNGVTKKSRAELLLELLANRFIGRQTGQYG